MKISVVIPCYNCSSTISKCLDSIKAQTVQPMEVIVVNDGSTDATAKTVSEYGGVKLIEHSRNEGLSVARNTGIHNADGDVVAFFDSDVDINPEYLRILCEDFEKYPEVAGVGGQEIPALKDNKYNRFRAKYMVQSSGRDSIYNVGALYGLAMAFRREVFQSVGLFNPEFRTNGEDVFISAKIRKGGHTLYYDHRLVVTHWKNVTSSREIRNIVSRSAYYGTRGLMYNGVYRDFKSKAKRLGYEIKRSFKKPNVKEYPILRFTAKLSEIYAVGKALFCKE